MTTDLTATLNSCRLRALDAWNSATPELVTDFPAEAPEPEQAKLRRWALTRWERVLDAAARDDLVQAHTSIHAAIAITEESVRQDCWPEWDALDAIRAAMQAS